MEIKHTIEILTKDIQDIENLVGNLQNSQDRSTLELDLALSKLRNVYEILTMIREDIREARNRPADSYVSRTTHDPSRAAELAPVAEVPKTEPVVEVPKTEPVAEVPKPEPVAEAPKTEPVAEAPRPEPVAEAPKPEPVAEAPRPEPVDEEPETAGKEAEILAEKFSTQSSINENMAGKRGEDIDAKLIGQPIDNISKNIGINDRFLIIRELFDGDSDSFGQLVGHLDGAGNYQEAVGIIEKSFSSSMDHEGVDILVGLAKRRFSKE